MKIKVSIAMEKELVSRLDSIAKISNESRSQVIERMVRDQIMTAEQFANLMANPAAREAMIKQFGNPEVMDPMFRAMGEKSPSKRLRKELAETAERVGPAGEDVKKGKGRKP